MLGGKGDEEGDEMLVGAFIETEDVDDVPKETTKQKYVKNKMIKSL